MSDLSSFAIKVPNAKNTIRIGGLHGCAQVLALAKLGQRRRVLVFVNDAASALRVIDQLRSLMDHDKIFHLVGWEVLPHDQTSPPRASVSERLTSFAALAQGRAGIYVCVLTDALFPCIPPSHLLQQVMLLEEKQKINLKSFASLLVAAGCEHVDRVRNPGEFALYGGQLDLYPGGQFEPARLVVDEDRIEQIRIFDPSTQLSVKRIDSLKILPAREYPLNDEAIKQFRRRWREHFEPGLSDDLYDLISRGKEAEGAEFFLPLFYGQQAYLFNYLSSRDVVWIPDNYQDVIDQFISLVAERKEVASLDQQAALDYEELFLNLEQFEQEINKQPVIKIANALEQADIDLGTRKLPALAVQRNAAKPYAQLAKWLSTQQGRIVFVASGHARLKNVEHALRSCGIKVETTNKLQKPKHGMFVMSSRLNEGFVLGKSKFAVVTEAELHGYVPAIKNTRRLVVSAEQGFSELIPGMIVAHQDHGLARYLGLESIEGNEFVALEFANKVKLFVAVSDCHLVSRYRQPEPGEEIKLHSLGSSRWRRTYQKAQKVAGDTAAHLLEIYAKRELTGKRQPSILNEAAYEKFCAGFEYIDTADQLRISAELVADLLGSKPMDRLVCGDVGFGKTELAMRAAFVAFLKGQQVAVVTPTTLLAEQTLNNFIERFSETEAIIVGLSSLNTGQTKRDQTLKLLAEQKVDIVIGTHALFEPKVKIPNLGLVIIDEEHRFGVRQKEKLRQLRAGVDVLAMSATPIPRSFFMALEGLRDVSLLATPPSDRLAVKTFVARDEDSIMREALTREYARGGQTFVVHHRVQTIRSMKERVAALLPKAKIETAHGQESPAQLEDIMRNFYAGNIDVLVSTTIIESGIDVPNANTVIVPQSQYFGLAQLHQLRGRVGRSNRQAYAYFLLQSDLTEKTKAASRLATLKSSSQLGGGYYIAMQDLEIRGAGQILGDAQSGVVTDVGIETFRHLLTKAVRSIDTQSVRQEICHVDFGGQARLPEDYCANPVERMRLYQQLAATQDNEQLQNLRDSFLDRFGPIPLAAKLLIDSHRLRIRASSLGITKIEAKSNVIKFSFIEQPPCVRQILKLIGENENYSLSPKQVLTIKHEKDVAKQMELATEVCKKLDDSRDTATV